MDITALVISTHNYDVLCVQPRDISGLAPSSHEEADTRVKLIAKDGVKQWQSTQYLGRVLLPDWCVHRGIAKVLYEHTS